MIARCIVEIGTSSYYSALREAAAEPVLQEICRHIAADELRHFRLFYKHLDRCLVTVRIYRLPLMGAALVHAAGSEANHPASAPSPPTAHLSPLLIPTPLPPSTYPSH